MNGLILESLRHNQAPIATVFFNAMMAGYASSTPHGVEIEDLPGSKLIKYREGLHWLVTDLYITSCQHGYSRGMTIIYYDGVPVWSMGYRGHYPHGTIPVLKQALYTAYRSCTFYGGRGPDYLECDEGRYYNSIQERDFHLFSGHEVVAGLSGEKGYHHYEGGLMI